MGKGPPPYKGLWGIKRPGFSPIQGGHTRCRGMDGSVGRSVRRSVVGSSWPVGQSVSKEQRRPNCLYDKHNSPTSCARSQVSWATPLINVCQVGERCDRQPLGFRMAFEQRGPGRPEGPPPRPDELAARERHSDYCAANIAEHCGTLRTYISGDFLKQCFTKQFEKCGK